MAAGALIGIDWGTTSLRAFLLDGAGAILDRRDGPHGIMSVKDGDFAGVLSKTIGPWISGGPPPVLLSGMIGSRQGWVEAPYVDVPAGIADLAEALVSVPFDAADVRLVAGLKDASGTMDDVVRAEEVQVLGAMTRLGIDQGRFLLPGTHSKWIHAEDGRITRFATYMTGEVYDALRNHTILGRLMQDGEMDVAAFNDGVDKGAAAGAPGALLHRLFGVRTAGLFGHCAPPGLADLLSGLLIGAEIADQFGVDGSGVQIVASASLAERYALAASHLGLKANIVSADCVADGHVAIAKLAGMI